MLRQIQNAKDIVEDILAHDFFSRDDDVYLLLEVWKKQGLNLPYETREWILKEGFVPESIRRLRQKFQEQDLYVGHKKLRRMIEQDKVKDWTKGLF